MFGLPCSLNFTHNLSLIPKPLSQWYVSQSLYRAPVNSPFKYYKLTTKWQLGQNLGWIWRYIVVTVRSINYILSLLYILRAWQQTMIISIIWHFISFCKWYTRLGKNIYYRRAHIFLIIYHSCFKGMQILFKMYSHFLKYFRIICFELNL